MARGDDEDTPWTRLLLVGVGALVAVAVIIGAVVSVVALGAAKVSGINDTRSEATQPPSLFFPSAEPTTTPEGVPDPERSDQTDPGAPASVSPKAAPQKRARVISLQAFPRRVSPNERVNLTGVYKGAEGSRLQVQRFENGWADFPVSTSVSGGLFDTYVFSRREGVNRFRMVDKVSGGRSNAVRVLIR